MKSVVECETTTSDLQGRRRRPLNRVIGGRLRGPITAPSTLNGVQVAEEEIKKPEVKEVEYPDPPQLANRKVTTKATTMETEQKCQSPTYEIMGHALVHVHTYVLYMTVQTEM